jgi:hypothetical protein
LAGSDQPLVAFFDVYPVLYGAQRSLLTLYSHWHRGQRYRLHFLYCVEGELSEAIRSAGIPATKLDPGPLLGTYPTTGAGEK